MSRKIPKAVLSNSLSAQVARSRGRGKSNREKYPGQRKAYLVGANRP
jgi:hypothetical protein